MKYYIIAGEASGDLHASNIIREIKSKDQNAEFRGWGGDLMKREGVDLVKHYKDHNYMGFWEVIKHIKTILSNIKFCKKDIHNYQPDALVLIDFPGFNLRIAKHFSSYGFPILYYIAPQVWAWKEKRVKQIKQYVTQLYVILPFEKAFFKKHNITASYVGHPLVDHIEQFIENQSLTKEEFYARYEIHENKEILTLLPGSRKQEIVKKLPVMLKAAHSFSKDYTIVIGGIETFKELYKDIIGDRKVYVVYNDTYNLLSNSYSALVTSGTATLETAFFNVPQVVCYKSSWVSYRIAKLLVKIKYISLVNLILDKECVKELIQSNLNESNLISELRIILNKNSRNRILKDYLSLKSICAGKNASKLTAIEMLKTIQNHKSLN